MTVPALTSCLLLDLGNTRLKWAWMDGANSGSEHIYAQSGAIAWATINEQTSLPFLESIDVVPGMRIALCSVQSAERTAWVCTQLTTRWPQARIERLSASAQALGVQNGYTDPMQLGADRWAALLAAHSLFPGENLLVVSAGTATTVDALRAIGQNKHQRQDEHQHQHLGGLILPGLQLMQQSLAQGTAQLPAVSDLELTRFPQDTHHAIASGCLAAQCGAIERFAITHNEWQPQRVVMTGGAAAQLLPYLNLSSQLELRENLVLEGLHCWLRAH